MDFRKTTEDSSVASTAHLKSQLTDSVNGWMARCLLNGLGKQFEALHASGTVLTGARRFARSCTWRTGRLSRCPSADM